MRVGHEKCQKVYKDRFHFWVRGGHFEITFKLVIQAHNTEPVSSVSLIAPLIDHDH